MAAATLIAAGGLAIAGGWQSAAVLRDRHRILSAHPDGRVYRPEMGWTDHALLDTRARWARLGLCSVTGLAVVRLGQAAGAIPDAAAVALSIVCCAGVVSWLQRDRRLHHGRYTSVCITELAVLLALCEAAPVAGGALASLLAAQLYTVAAIRKLRAPYFTGGRVIEDGVAYGVWQAAGCNRDFAPLALLTPRRMAGLLSGGRFLAGCKAASAVTAGVELGLGLGAMGLFPLPVTIAVAVPAHLAFTLISPSRVVPFTVAALALLVLATTQPILSLQT